VGKRALVLFHDAVGISVVAEHNHGYLAGGLQWGRWRRQDDHENHCQACHEQGPPLTAYPDGGLGNPLSHFFLLMKIQG
jgi:hypothetical protein